MKYFIGILLALAICLAIRSIVKNKKAGKFSCGGNCASCMMSCASKSAYDCNSKSAYDGIGQVSRSSCDATEKEGLR